ncbi:LysR family transcriptional regulator [Mesorhizobium sp. NPDC059054]|uniref:LysR family transcriptional regulator n=1 Tax=Mesorhizobium sp. NPDC059054 TaxID=3346711 RepID=UPI0036C3FA19
MKISTRQILAFVTIARQQSFSQAANVLRVTQPSLSVLIRDLEQTLSVSVFDRNTRGVRLSQAGMQLLPTAERILSDLQRLEETSGDLSGLADGEVRVACSSVLASGALPIAIRKFGEDFPGVRIVIRDTAEQNLVELVRNDLVDFAIATRVETDPRIVQQMVQTDQMAAYVAPDHPFAATETIAWRQLGDTPLALLDRNSPLRHIVDKTAGQLGIWLNTRYEVTFGTTALALAEQGLAVAILPANAMRNDHSFRCVRRIMVKPQTQRGIMLIRLANRKPVAAAEKFWAYCKHQLSEESAFDLRAKTRPQDRAAQ